MKTNTSKSEVIQEIPENEKRHHHFSVKEFGSRAGEHHNDIGVTASTSLRRIHESIKTPEQLMLYSIFEMQKHIVFMLAKTDEDIREYAMYTAFFECALNNIK
jgi:hypothetical protein